MRDFEEGIEHAKMTGQTPTRWFVSKCIDSVFYKGENRALAGGPEILGLPISFNPDLPANKVVLKAGENTVCAFHVSLILNLEDATPS